MRYGFVLDARVKALLRPRLGDLPGLRINATVVRPGGQYGVRGDFRVPDFEYRGAGGLEYWDLKPPGFSWSQQFQDIMTWTGVRPIPLLYNR